MQVLGENQRHSVAAKRCLSFVIETKGIRHNDMTKKEFTKVISHSGDDRLRLRIETKNGKVVDIVVQYEGKFNDEWHPIVRYDCAHGFLHRDVLFPGGKKEKQPLDIPD